ncbi:N-acetylgalactosaminyltransferase 6-like [Uranotaenia lowii]|uniref:N-acetylgalactosaminyltransferase 6-like n=1 Tax=Uranotaenia lowii TaxID=190385 RepID=UPI00247A0346|nr:N-acetylgalactosaminyltransferase 6-like [Uranotaenia lowii]
MLKSAFTVSCLVFGFMFLSSKNENLSNLKNSIYLRYTGVAEPFFNGVPRNVDGSKVDWHDYAYLERESARTGPGENGTLVILEDAEDIKQNEKLFTQNGYYAVVSDMIAVDRALNDLRHPGCLKKHYLQELPTVSVVIIFYNEHMSTLLRTVHSVLNRSPPQLLKEIIMVNDHSTKEFLYHDLEEYIKSDLPPKVRLIHLPERSGLIKARLAGAKLATGDVLVVLDSHTEAGTNWLPPLLEPIAMNYRTCVCPLIDIIDFKTFQMRKQDDGKRGAFNWRFQYKRLPLRPGDQTDPTEPFESPIMAGGLFAISLKFFWELGGYDEGLDIWGAEQYELSFKIWQCGGRMVDAPCSRVGHIYRGYSPFPNPRGKDFVTKNNKRVAEVWMDEYKQYIYQRNSKYRETDTGDLTLQRAVRERLQCKPFKYFMEKVAPDLAIRYPLIEPPVFASGPVQSLDDTNFCLDTLNHGRNEPIGIYPCTDNKTYHLGNQQFDLRYYRDIRATHLDLCLDASDVGSEVILFSCHEIQGNQMFQYELETKLIRHAQPRLNRCLDIVDKRVVIAKCNPGRKSQQWAWGSVDEARVRNWRTSGTKLLDPMMPLKELNLSNKQ